MTGNSKLLEPILDSLEKEGEYLETQLEKDKWKLTSLKTYIHYVHLDAQKARARFKGVSCTLREFIGRLKIKESTHICFARVNKKVVVCY